MIDPFLALLALFIGVCAGITIAVLSLLPGGRKTANINVNFDKGINIKFDDQATLNQLRFTNQELEKKIHQLSTSLGEQEQRFSKQEERLSRLERPQADMEPTTTVPIEDDKNALVTLWKGCSKRDEFAKKVEEAGYKFQTFRGKDEYSGEQLSSESIWVVSKGDRGFVLPAWNVRPGSGLWLFYKNTSGDLPIRDIKKLAEVTFKDSEATLCREFGELGE